MEIGLPVVAAPPCERCELTDVDHTLAADYADYWRCRECGHIWATEKPPREPVASTWSE